MALNLIQMLLPVVTWLLIVLPFATFMFFGIRMRSTPPLFNLMLYIAIASPVIMMGALFFEDFLLKLLLSSIEVDSAGVFAQISANAYKNTINFYIVSDGGRNSMALIVSAILPIYVLLVTASIKLFAFVCCSIRGKFNEQAV